jgi:hypothetical protein
MMRTREVGPRHSSNEAAERSGAPCCGAIRGRVIQARRGPRSARNDLPSAQAQASRGNKRYVLIQVNLPPILAFETSRDRDSRLDPDQLVAAAVGISEAEQQQRAHVRDGSIACALGYQAPPQFPECLLTCCIEREMIEAPAAEHRLIPGRLDPRDLKWMQDSMRTHFDKGVPQTLLFEVDRYARAENALVEINQPIHVGRDKRQVMDIVQ